MLIERLMVVFARRYYECNPDYVDLLTAEKTKELKDAFDSFVSSADGPVTLDSLGPLVRSLGGDLKYMKDDEIEEMTGITVGEFRYVRNLYFKSVGIPPPDMSDADMTELVDAQTKAAQVATQNQHFPTRARRGEVAIRLDDLDDLAHAVIGARVGGIDLIFGSACIVGQHDVGAAGLWVGLHIFRSVHRRGAQKVSRPARLDQDFALAVKAVGFGQRAGAKGERHPLHSAVRVKAGHIERAVIQQVAIGGAIARRIATSSDEFIHIIKALVVAHIEHHTPVWRDDAFSAFMLEAAKGGALFRS